MSKELLVKDLDTIANGLEIMVKLTGVMMRNPILNTPEYAGLYEGIKEELQAVFDDLAHTREAFSLRAICVEDRVTFWNALDMLYDNSHVENPEFLAVELIKKFNVEVSDKEREKRAKEYDDYAEMRAEEHEEAYS